MSAIWVLHLFGGARATWAEDDKSGTVHVDPPVIGGQTLEFSADSVWRVIDRCNRLGLATFGAARITNKLELDGTLPPEWRTVHYLPANAWLCYDAETVWSQIAYAASKAKRGHLWDCAARIAYQLRSCVLSVQRISEGYATELFKLLARRDFPDGSRISDLWTQAIFLSIQSFFTEACVLRDYLAEFAASFLYRLPVQPRVTRFAVLLKHLKREQPIGELSDKLRSAGGRGGWLADVGAYRDLIIHSVPLALARKELWFWCRTIHLPQGRRLPTVRFPLPDNPGEIMATRHKLDFEDFDLLVKQLAGSANTASSTKDALRYTHDVIGKFADLALALSTHSPVTPQMPVITDDDLAGPVEWM